MRFASLSVTNFKAIGRLELLDLRDLVVIAGANGSGKSCVLDALRLVKSAYGGYQPDEINLWLSEFQINFSDPTQRRPLFRNPTTPIQIRAEAQLSEREKNFLDETIETLVEPLIWSELTGLNSDQIAHSTIPLATQYAQYGDTARRLIEERSDEIREQLSNEAQLLNIVIPLKGPIQVAPNRVMEVVFQTYDANHLGILDYHSANRTYAREGLGGITLDTHHLETQRKQSSLYNIAAKYQNVKTELAATFVRELIEAKAGSSDTRSLNDTLHELFHTFFPDKEYLGVTAQVDGSLEFPVRLRSGAIHDINELSSGEKEVLYGYLRLRNSTPRDSTILLDEPELHLNPALLRGFPDFYYRNLGIEFGNQLWLVTHSDALLRQAVGNPRYSVFHLGQMHQDSEDGNQATPITVDDELERATMDLVGDLASYRPRSKVVILEGSPTVEFDSQLIQRLFPDFAKRVNLISAGSKRSARGLYELLTAAGKGAGVADRFVVLTDRDRDSFESQNGHLKSFSWDVYHIENYLLIPEYIRLAANSLLGDTKFENEFEVKASLHECASALVPTLVMQELRSVVNSSLIGSIDLGSQTKATDPVNELRPAIEGSAARLRSELERITSPDWLHESEKTITKRYAAWLSNDDWMEEFPGRDILMRFASEYLGSKGSYSYLRNVLIDQLVSNQVAPERMAKILDSVLEA